MRSPRKVLEEENEKGIKKAEVIWGTLVSILAKNQY